MLYTNKPVAGSAMGDVLLVALTSETLGISRPLSCELISSIALASADAPVLFIATWEKTVLKNSNTNTVENIGGIFMILGEGGLIKV
jgi:hypothetical protein